MADLLSIPSIISSLNLNHCKTKATEWSLFCWLKNAALALTT